LGSIAPLIRIDPDGYIVMRDNLRPLDEAGIGPFLDIYLENLERAISADEGILIDRGEGEVFGRAVMIVEGVLPADEDKCYYCYRSVVHFDKQSGMPLKIEIYDWANRLREEYGYQDLELNPGLSDRDFDLENSEYGFR
jgi:hypothetical protein